MNEYKYASQSDVKTVNPEERFRIPRSIASAVNEIFYTVNSPDEITHLNANEQQQRFGDLEAGYVKGFERGIKESNIDTLTGAEGRRFFLHDLYHISSTIIRIAHSSSDESRKPELVVANLDVNHLKDTNDIFGHSMGDRLLQLLVGKIKENLRNYDIIGRVGGDEFGVIFPSGLEEDADPEYTAPLVERSLAVKMLQSLKLCQSEMQSSVLTLLHSATPSLRNEIVKQVREKIAANSKYDIRKVISLIGTASVGVKTYTAAELQSFQELAKIKALQRLQSTQVMITEDSLQIETEEQFYSLLNGPADVSSYHAKAESKVRHTSCVGFGNGKCSSLEELAHRGEL